MNEQKKLAEVRGTGCTCECDEVRCFSANGRKEVFKRSQEDDRIILTRTIPALGKENGSERHEKKILKAEDGHEIFQSFVVLTDPV